MQTAASAASSFARANAAFVSLILVGAFLGSSLWRATSGRPAFPLLFSPFSLPTILSKAFSHSLDRTAHLWTEQSGWGLSPSHASTLRGPESTQASSSSTKLSASTPWRSTPNPFACEALERRGFGVITREDVYAGLRKLHGLPVEPPRGPTDPPPLPSPMWHQQPRDGGPGGAVPNLSPCPKFVSTTVNGAAGIGHRFSNWAQAVNAAAYYNITYAYSFNYDSGVHGSYPEWRRLGLNKGEVTVEEVRNLPGISEHHLGCRGIRLGETMPHMWLEEHWGPHIRDPGRCNVLYVLPTDCWTYDTYTHIKSITAQKGMENFMGAPHLKLQAAWNPSHVNVAVHIRKGDVYSTAEEVQARIVQESVLPELARVGFGRPGYPPISVHVFAEFDGAETFPHMAAIGRVRHPDVPREIDEAEQQQQQQQQQQHANGKKDDVTVIFHAGLSTFATGYHFLLSDIFVLAGSGFSSIASALATRPLVVSVPSSNTAKMCHSTSVCCEENGRCGLDARARLRETAERLAAAYKCGLLEKRGDALE